MEIDRPSLRRLTRRGFESGVRYIARPTISEALFSYRRAA
jgi:hypothetical protein